MDVRLESLPRVEVLATVGLGAYAQTAPALWHDLWEALRGRGLAESTTGVYGFGMDHPGHTPAPLCRYVAAVSLPEMPTDIPGAFELTLPGGRYAIHRMRGPYIQMREVFPKLHDEWLPASGHVADIMRPFLEIYLNDPKTVDEGDILTDLCIPIAG